MSTNAQVVTATCPDCLVQIRFRKMPELEDLVTCPECEALLEIVQLKPLRLDWAYADEYEESYAGDAFDDDASYDDDDDWA